MFKKSCPVALQVEILTVISAPSVDANPALKVTTDCVLTNEL